jgi:Transposase IS116/IS110/IS902 family
MRRMAAEEITDLVRGPHLMDLHGIGPAGAARILSDVGDVARFPDRNHFATTWPPGPAPHRWTPPAETRSDTGYHGPGIDG